MTFSENLKNATDKDDDQNNKEQLNSFEALKMAWGPVPVWYISE